MGLTHGSHHITAESGCSSTMRESAMVTSVPVSIAIQALSFLKPPSLFTLMVVCLLFLGTKILSLCPSQPSFSLE